MAAEDGSSLHPPLVEGAERPAASGHSHQLRKRAGEIDEPFPAETVPSS